jgi:hypothetical protein
MTDILDRIGDQLERAEHDLWLMSQPAPPDVSHRNTLGAGRWLRRPLVAVIVALGVSGSAGGLALAGTFNTGTISPQAWIGGQRVAPEPSTTSDQTAMEILRRPRVATDALYPYDSQVFTNTPAGAAEGANIALSRRVQGLASGAAWVIPANDGNICLVAENAQGLSQDQETGPLPATHVPGATGITYCAPASQVTSGWYGGYATTAGTGGLASVYTAGIVPDGVTQIRLTFADGATTSLPVDENVWMGAVPSPPASISFTGPSGPVTRAGLPTSVRSGEPPQ